MARPIVTLTTDFGTADAFVGTMKGVILGISPDAEIVDITHDVPPQDVWAAAFLFDTAYRYFSAGTVHMRVVDPSVGTDRRPIVASNRTASFVGPDNGLLSYVLAREGGPEPQAEPFVATRTALPPGWSCHQLDNDRYWRQPLGDTFHGRDIFAPVAAAISTGRPPGAMGTATHEISAFAVPRPKIQDGTIAGCVLHVDRFGNLITNIGADVVLGMGAALSSKSAGTP